MRYIFISHDLGVVRHLSDRVIVMRKGASSRPAPGSRFLNPSTDYTKGLIAAVPSLARGGLANRSFSRSKQTAS